MQVVIPNQQLVKYLQEELRCGPMEFSNIVKYGIQLAHANQFLSSISLVYPASCIYVLNEFYRNFLGKYDYIATQENPFKVRFCNQIELGGQDGVELTLHDTKIVLCRLSAVLGSTTFIPLKEWKL
jgi:hypothetical protein